MKQEPKKAWGNKLLIKGCCLDVAFFFSLLIYLSKPISSLWRVKEWISVKKERRYEIFFLNPHHTLNHMVCRSRWNKRLDMVIIRHVRSLLLRRFSPVLCWWTLLFRWTNTKVLFFLFLQVAWNYFWINGRIYFFPWVVFLALLSFCHIKESILTPRLMHF